MTVWDRVLDLVEKEGRVSSHSFVTWFRPTAFRSFDGSVLSITVPSAPFRDWFLKNYSSLVSEMLASLGHASVRLQCDVETFGSVESLPVIEASSLNPKYTVRDLRGRRLQPDGPCRREGGRGGALQVLQPPFHLRGRRTRKDAPASGHRALSPETKPEARAHLCLERTLRQRGGFGHPLRADPSFPAAIPRHRCAHHRRHPVSLEQGAVPGRVLPPLQHSLRGRKAGRHLRGCSSEDADRGSRANAEPLLLGHVGGCGPAGYRNPGGDPPKTRGRGGHPPSRQRGALRRLEGPFEYPGARRVLSTASSPTPACEGSISTSRWPRRP